MISAADRYHLGQAAAGVEISFGNFPRVLGKYVRDEHVIPLEDAVRKMTSAVAERLSIHDRGVLLPGMFADVIIFDPATIQSHSTYEAPDRAPQGIVSVMKDGRIVYGRTPR